VKVYVWTRPVLPRSSITGRPSQRHELVGPDENGTRAHGELEAVDNQALALLAQPELGTLWIFCDVHARCAPEQIRGAAVTWGSERRQWPVEYGRPSRSIRSPLSSN
jgi:hypothetical protein